jgi:hypothetical protein
MELGSQAATTEEQAVGGEAALTSGHTWRLEAARSGSSAPALPYMIAGGGDQE